MKLYGMKMYNFMRFGESDNTIVFNVTKDQKKLMQSGSLTFDKMYEELSADPLVFIDKANTIKDDNIFDGIVGIAGMTSGSFDSSNGSGKSTIFEAMAFLFYDKVVRQTANTDSKGNAGLSVVTKLAGEYPKDLKESYVEGYFEEDKRIYRLKRGRSFTKTKNNSSPIFEFDCIKDDEVDSLSSHRKRDTKRSLDQVIIEDYDIFVNTVMFGQADAGKFLTGTDKTKKDMVIELLKLEDIVHGCIDIIRSKKRDETEKLSSQTTRIESFQDLVKKEYIKSPEFNSALAQNSNYNSDYEDSMLPLTIQSLLNRIKESEAEKDAFAIEMHNVEKDIKTLEDSDVIKEVARLTEEGKELVKQKSNKEQKKVADIKDWNQLLIETGPKISLCEKSIEEAKFNILKNIKLINTQEDVVNIFDEESYNEKIEKCKIAADSKDKYKDKLKEAETHRDLLVHKISSFDASIQLANKDLSSLQNQVDNAGESEKFVCKECQSIVTKDHTLKKISDIKKVVAENVILRDELNIKLGNVNSARTKAREVLQKIDEYAITHQKLIREKESVENAKVAMSNIQLNLDQNNKILLEKNKDLEEFQSKLVEYKKKCSDIENSYKDEIASIESDIVEKRKLVIEKREVSKEIESQILSKKEERIRYKSLIADIDKKCGSLQEKHEQMTSLEKQMAEEKVCVEETKKQIQRYKILESAFGLEGVQTRIVAKYLPLLNMYVKQFLDILSNGKLSVSLYVNDKSKVDMEIVGGTADNYVMLSGGEKMVVRLAVDVGLSLLSFSRTSRTPDMICLDEIFGPLDPEHTRSVFLMLNELKDRFKKVFLISHKSEIQSLVENNIIVEKSSGNRGLSKITGIRDVSV